jgi:hypothetical protein
MIWTILPQVISCLFSSIQEERSLAGGGSGCLIDSSNRLLPPIFDCRDLAVSPDPKKWTWFKNRLINDKVVTCVPDCKSKTWRVGAVRAAVGGSLLVLSWEWDTFGWCPTSFGKDKKLNAINERQVLMYHIETNIAWWCLIGTHLDFVTRKHNLLKPLTSQDMPRSL